MDRRRVEGNVTRAFGYLYEEDTEMPAERPASIKKSAFGTTLSRSRGL